MIALKTRFNPKAAADLQAAYELRLGEDVFRAAVADGRFELARGSAERPAAIVETDAATLRSVIFGGKPLAEALAANTLEVHGDLESVTRFVALFAATN